MVLLSYDRRKLVLFAIGVGMVLPAILWMVAGIAGLIEGALLKITAVGLVVGGLRFAFNSVGDMTALRGDAEGLTVKTNWRTIAIPWAEFVDVGGEAVNATSSLAAIKQVTYLMIYRRKPGATGVVGIRLVGNVLDLDNVDAPRLGKQIAQLRESLSHDSRRAPPPAAAPMSRFGRKAA